MRIRDLKWRSLAIWPPEWSFADEGVGELGFLVRVELRKDRNPEFIYIEAKHAGNTLKGITLLEDSSRLELLCRKLRENLGKPLVEIGDLEINF